MGTYYPSLEKGYLPAWILVLSSIALYQTAKSYIGVIRAGSAAFDATRASRNFGTWTLLGSVLRLYTAYDIQNGGLYDVTIWSFVIGFAYFGLEWVVFGISVPGRRRGLVITLGTCIWMLIQRNHYIESSASL
ncbi:Erg28 like protein-domain-containing protein [Bisporella sp. PMI_857]|nr:Erg28 like protein-domain-containing protein [Bisporella sp. PMI_857]